MLSVLLTRTLWRVRRWWPSTLLTCPSSGTRPGARTHGASHPDCTLLTGLISDYANKRIFKRPANYAGGELKGQPRRIAVISPDNPEYQQCVDYGVEMIKREGNTYAMREAYTLDIASLSSQAASLVAKMRSQDITSIACVCDPILPIFMTAKAREQTWFPEWFVTARRSPMWTSWDSCTTRRSGLTLSA